MVQITAVSINSSSKPTKPSLTGSLVWAVECAIAAGQIPASLENTARRKPMIITPMIPPLIPWGSNAPFQIAANAPGSFS